MGTKRNVFKKLVLGVAVPGVTLGTLAGFAAAPAMASTNMPPAGHYETISGYSNGGDNVSVQATGAFNDYGSINVNTDSDALTVKLSRGNLKLYAEESGEPSVHFSESSCFLTFRGTEYFDVTKGTGRYKGVSGEGTATLTESAGFPRMQGGGCNTDAGPILSTVHIAVVAKATLTLPGNFS